MKTRRSASRLLLPLLPLLVLIAAWPTAAHADRGRPFILKSAGPGLSGTMYDTLVADNGNLLRGARWSSDLGMGCAAPTHAQITYLRSLGINALHLYGEAFQQGYAAGHCQSTIDAIVNWTGQDGLYLILTIGNGYNNGTYDANFANAFWTHYAPLYKERTHVIYEIQNEPYFNGSTSQPSPPALLTFERNMYTLIRSSAPSTPILLMSYAVFNNAAGVQSDVAALTGVSWSNAAIAFHGYAQLSDTDATMLTLLTPSGSWTGIPLVATEFYDGALNQQDVNQTIVYEDHYTSWLSFLDLAMVADDAKFKTLLDNAWVVWGADYGIWPATDDPPYGAIVSFQASQLNQKWVSALNTTTPLTADSSTVGTNQRFRVVYSGEGKWVGLEAQSNLKIACADYAGSSPLLANRTAVGFWEEFEWMKRPDGTVVLRARANMKIVSADLNRTYPNPPQLIANRKLGGPWERFTVLMQ